MRKKQQGFSLIELLLTIGILTVIFSIATINLSQASHRTYEDNTATTLASDLKSQQVKAMNGDTQGSGTNSDYGIYFESGKYTLFRGDNYSSSDATNFVVTLPASVQLTNILFPNNKVVFTSGSGEIVGFVNGANSLKIINSQDNSQKTVSINRFGVITSN